MQVNTQPVFHAWIDESDPQAAVKRIVEGVGTNEPSITFLFVTAGYDLDGLAEALRDRLHGPILACTTAGQLVSDNGYAPDGMAVAAIRSDQLHARVSVIENIRAFGVDEAQQLIQQLGVQPSNAEHDAGQFGVLLVDGMCRCEERIAALLHGASDGLPFVGGSAGDDGRFVTTHVFDGKQFRSNIAAFALIETTLPYHLFRFQHFEPSMDRLVVTKADPAKRQIIELNGQPATQAYCGQIGHDALDENIVARYPLLLQCGDEYYARGIQSWDSESLYLFCSIEEGMVVRIGRANDLVQTLQSQLESLQTSCGGKPILTVAFDCILRRLEVQKQNDESRFRDVVRAHRVVGFSTYGEQFGGLHINQTMTGFAIAA